MAQPDIITRFVADIGEAAATGPGTQPGQKVANSLSPGFSHFVAERGRKLVQDHATGQLEAVAELFKKLDVALLEEDNKLGNTLVPDRNHEAVQAVAADCAKTRLQLLEGLRIQLNAIIRSNIK